MRYAWTHNFQLSVSTVYSGIPYTVLLCHSHALLHNEILAWLISSLTGLVACLRAG